MQVPCSCRTCVFGALSTTSEGQGAGANTQGSLCAYDFGTWDLSWPDYPRWSINFYAFNSSDILDNINPDAHDDEVRCVKCLVLCCNFQPMLALPAERGAAAMHAQHDSSPKSPDCLQGGGWRLSRRRNLMPGVLAQV